MFVSFLMCTCTQDANDNITLNSTSKLAYCTSQNFTNNIFFVHILRLHHFTIIWVTKYLFAYVIIISLYMCRLMMMSYKDGRL